ncbi:ribosomal RNA 16S methyltransferase RsmE [Acidiphilium multivorum AIU301]|jgi:16S rRNA (uracil1498-N3)-methyltransferase|uniref:16S rRNA (uracil(1498)-N(3))-methyltransferase n=1 Tax=Acidiphilium TaxID=522 RepID=UPI0002F6FBE4|nr:MULTISPECIES: 16S rRNA (uracil(1498)-N(3))-methyltransferase [Acidiphilium]GAN73307.1 ribosomal RNA 16S methyltransferase RsmE [Acidiphilium multivorum AIU301]
MASLIRLHLPSPLSPGATLATSAAQAHYLGAVMRRRAGDRLLVFNAGSGEFAATIGALDRRAATLVLGARTRAPEPEPDCWLCFAPLRRDMTELVVEKATELGVSRLVPVLTARTQPARLRADRLAAIATEAAEQSERLTIPDIAEPAPLAAFLASFPPSRRLFVAAERHAAPPLSPADPLQPHALLVGPEGGLAPEELDAMARHAFVSPVTLGPRILRAETAAIAGLARLLAGSAPS